MAGGADGVSPISPLISFRDAWQAAAGILSALSAKRAYHLCRSSHHLGAGSPSVLGPAFGLSSSCLNPPEPRITSIVGRDRTNIARNSNEHKSYEPHSTLHHDAPSDTLVLPPLLPPSLPLIYYLQNHFISFGTLRTPHTQT